MVGEAADGVEAVDQAEETLPDVIVMDVGMPKRGGIDACRVIKQRVPSARILMLRSWEGRLLYPTGGPSARPPGFGHGLSPVPGRGAFLREASAEGMWVRLTCVLESRELVARAPHRTDPLKDHAMSESQSQTNSASTAVSSPEVQSPLVTEMGKTTIADTVVSKIAGIAAREVAGVHALGGGTARAVGALRERIPGGRTNHAQGVSVEVGERQAAVDVQLVADYGVAIADLAQGIRRNVIAAIERMTSLEVTEVNIDVQDVFLETDDESQDQEQSQRSEPRVQ